MVLRFPLDSAEFADIEVVAINGLEDPEYMLHMLQYDSVHGRFKFDAHFECESLYVDGKKIHLSSKSHPADIDWAAVGVLEREELGLAEA